MIERLLEKIDFGDTDECCWQWTSSLSNKGYGQFWLDGKSRKAHRITYEIWAGPIPEGKQLDHLCRNRACVNPMHLEPVTSGENTRRGETGQNMAQKTHCPQGHPYDEENTYHTPCGRRQCRICVKSAQERYKARKAQKRAELEAR